MKGGGGKEGKRGGRGRWKRKETGRWPPHPDDGLDHGATRSQSEIFLLFQGGSARGTRGSRWHLTQFEGTGTDTSPGYRPLWFAEGSGPFLLPLQAQEDPETTSAAPAPRSAPSLAPWYGLKSAVLFISRGCQVRRRRWAKVGALRSHMLCRSLLTRLCPPRALCVPRSSPPAPACATR